jgi:peptide/nickel transport system permease protein
MAVVSGIRERIMPAFGSSRWPRKSGFYVGAGFILLLLAISYLVPTPYPPNATNPNETFVAPGPAHLLGTDVIGRDVLSRVMAAARTDLPLAILGTGVALAIGVPLGLVASTRSRAAALIMRCLDMLQAFPLLILAIVLVALAGSNIYNIIPAIALIGGPTCIRLVRSAALSLRESRFAEASYAMGSTTAEVMRRHILPNVMPNIIAQASLIIAGALIVVSALSFLGIGIKPPTASWGAMLSDARDAALIGYWWVAVVPGAIIFLAILSFNLMADGIEASLHGD